jgi:hypothetical protein
MTGNEGEGSKTSYTLQEVNDMIAKERAKFNDMLKERVNDLVSESLKKQVEEGVLSGGESISPKGKSSTPEDGVAFGGLPSKGVDPSKLPTTSLQNVSWAYPPQHIPMPHMNPSGSPPKLDEGNFSFRKSSMHSQV